MAEHRILRGRILRDTQFRLRELARRAYPVPQQRRNRFRSKPQLAFAALGLLLTAIFVAPHAHLTPATAEIDFGRRGVMPYEAFDQLELNEIRIGDAVLKVGFAPGGFDLAQQRYLDWVQRSAEALATYYGRFPVPDARILIIPTNGKGVRFGQAFGHGGAAVKVMVGRQSDWGDLTADWIMVHEMIHLAFPQLSRRHAWLSEGLAVYVESIARVQAAHLTADEVWREFAGRMPHGLPKQGDQGLDNTGTWGRTYWGGAIYCLIADIEIRKRTQNRLGLQDALRAVIAAGGGLDKEWSVPETLTVADRAIGITVMMGLYEDMRDRPVAPDLETLWRDLGLRREGTKLTFDDTAPLAHIRQAITASASPSPASVNGG